MGGIEIKFSITGLKMNAQQLKKELKTANRKAMVRQLAFVRTRARSVLGKKTKQVSRPGQPPKIHVDSGHWASLRHIYFEFDPQTETGIVGPVKGNRVNFVSGMGSLRTAPIPNILEFGGTMKIPEMLGDDGEWFRMRANRRRRPEDAGRKKRVRRVRIAPRPFMSTALDLEIKAGTITDPWKNVIGG